MLISDVGGRLCVKALRFCDRMVGASTKRHPGEGALSQATPLRGIYIACELPLWHMLISDVGGTARVKALRLATGGWGRLQKGTPERVLALIAVALSDR